MRRMIFVLILLVCVLINGVVSKAQDNSKEKSNVVAGPKASLFKAAWPIGDADKATAPAGLIDRLPVDGAWARFEMGGRLVTIASVGRTTVQTQPCRWIEVIFDEAGPIQVWKLLIPEGYLPGGQNILDGALAIWHSQGEEEPVNITGMWAKGGLSPLTYILTGPDHEIRSLATQLVETKLGQIACPGWTGRQVRESNQREIDTTYRQWVHEKAPFGVVCAEMQYVIKFDGQVKTTDTTSIVLASVGTDARSQISTTNLSAIELTARPFAPTAGWQWVLQPERLDWMGMSTLGLSMLIDKNEKELRFTLAYPWSPGGVKYRPVAFDVDQRRYEFMGPRGGASGTVGLMVFTLAEDVLPVDQIKYLGIEKQSEEVHKVPLSLVGKSLPNFWNIKFNFVPTSAKDKEILVCFFDMGQRPSRHLIDQLTKRAEWIKQKGRTIVAVQASKIDENSLNEWVRKNDIPFPVGIITGDEEKARYSWGIKSLPWLIVTAHGRVIRTGGFGEKVYDELMKIPDTPPVWQEITGTVRDPDGVPIEGVEIEILPDIYAGSSDVNGKFEIRRDPSKEEGHLSFRHIKRNLAVVIPLDEDVKTIDVRLLPGVVLTGKVLDTEGKPIPEAKTLLTMLFGRWGHNIGNWNPTTDSQGHYKVKAVPSEYKYIVRAKAEGYGDQYVNIHTDDVEKGHLKVPSIVLAVANLSVSGVVVDQDDRPVASAKVYTEGRGQPHRQTQTDSEGKFTIEKVCAGTLGIRSSLDLEGPNKLWGEIKTQGGASDVKLVMVELDSDGREIPQQPKRPPSLVGKALPGFEGIDIEFDAAKVKGKKILVCFFDIGQRPSRHCVRELAKKAEQLKAKGVTVVAVQSSKVDKDKLNKWVEENNISFAVGMVGDEEEKARFKWGVKSLPWLILTDKEHIVRAMGFGLGQLDEKLAATQEPITQEETEKHQRAAAEDEIKRLGGVVAVKTSENGELYIEVKLLGPRYESEWKGGDEGIKYLKYLPNLKKLRIQDVEKFSDEGMAHLKDVKSLESLMLVRTEVSDEGLIYLKDLTNLEFLGLGSNSQFTNKALDHMKGLTKLKSLRLDDAQITDEGVKKLKEFGLLERLEFLVLSQTKISDAGLAHLKGMVNLKRLYLNGAKVTDVGLAHLAGLGKLEWLILNNTEVSDAGLVHLQGLKDLYGLYLNSTRVSNAGIEHLKVLTNLVELWLGGTQITDAGLVNLKGLTKLQSLSLESTQVTDAGMDHVKALTSLNELFLKYSDVTYDGYTNLQEVLPDCRIYWEEKKLKGPITSKEKISAKTLVSPAATSPNTPSQPIKNEPNLPKTIVTVKRKPGTVSIVKCDDGVHSYAVCLPSDYEKREKCPVIFCFDPGGNGKLAVRKFAFSAEKYGCIIVGSLDAKNGPWKTILKAQSTMLEDIPKRYKTDEKKYYAAGFSGGARMSYTIAYNNPSKFKGVIACGGGFGLGKISKDVAVYHCAGNADSAGMFEVKKIHSELQRNGVKSELNVFSGGHNWPPRIVIKQALDWLMKKTK